MNKRKDKYYKYIIFVIEGYQRGNIYKTCHSIDRYHNLSLALRTGKRIHKILKNGASVNLYYGHNCNENNLIWCDGKFTKYYGIIKRKERKYEKNNKFYKKRNKF